MIYSNELTNCLITGDSVVDILDLGMHPFADTFIGADQLHMSEPVFPLQLTLCASSGMVQLMYASDDTERYNLYDYSYTSSHSESTRKYWNSFADTMDNFHDPKFVVEIGSNDGYLLQQFKNRGKKVYGVDASRSMCSIANKAGIPTLESTLNLYDADYISGSMGKPDLIIANNVLNHANDPAYFMKCIAAMMHKDSVFVFEVPYWGEMVDTAFKHGKFPDMIYHEHISYFTVKSCDSLLKSVGLTLTGFCIVPNHGGSLRVEARWKESDQTEVQKQIAEEERKGLFNRFTYFALQKLIERNRAEWLLKFYDMVTEDPDAVFIGVGAAAKANTWLNWHRMDNKLIRYITDSSEHKLGKYTPLSRIPIIDDSVFEHFESPIALILSWNLSDALKKKILSINPNTRFLLC